MLLEETATWKPQLFLVIEWMDQWTIPRVFAILFNLDPLLRPKILQVFSYVYWPESCSNCGYNLTVCSSFYHAMIFWIIRKGVFSLISMTVTGSLNYAKRTIYSRWRQVHSFKNQINCVSQKNIEKRDKWKQNKRVITLKKLADIPIALTFWLPCRYESNTSGKAFLKIER